MCKVYHIVGSLKTVKYHLERNNITDFSSVNELLSFQKNYQDLREQVYRTHKLMIEQEKVRLGTEIVQMETDILTITRDIESEHDRETQDHQAILQKLLQLTPNGLFRKILVYFKTWSVKKKLADMQRGLEAKKMSQLRPLLTIQSEKTQRLDYIKFRHAEAVDDSALSELLLLQKKKSVIDELTTSIYGALGEQKVVKELEKLPDDYHLINDLSISFSRPIYYQQDQSYIRSIQIDHVLIGPSGVFLIETKNWSEQSLANLSLRSPVQQTARSSFVLFRILSDAVSNHRLQIGEHHWGKRKIPIKNLIVLTNKKPVEEFQYVKILTLNELVGYVSFFKPIFSGNETNAIASYLLRWTN